MKEQIINLYNKLQKENASIYREMQECYEKEDFKQAGYWKGKYAAFSFCIDELDKISNLDIADVINSVIIKEEKTDSEYVKKCKQTLPILLKALLE